MRASFARCSPFVPKTGTIPRPSRLHARHWQPPDLFAGVSVRAGLLRRHFQNDAYAQGLQSLLELQESGA